MSTAPALYDLTIRHTRLSPVRNVFRYRSFSWLIDIDHPPKLPRPLRALASFDARDHVDVRAQLATSGIVADRILMLANARVLGYVFNPISIFWCYRDDSLAAVVAEVHNTYGGRHAYVLQLDATGHADTDKELYVSPFYPVDGHYRIHVTEPGERLSVSVTLHRAEGERFVATMAGERRPATAGAMLRMWARYPVAPLRVSALIRWQGIRLWRRGLAVVPR
ncbi:MAG TPA: DUF1365 domain-containing protein [Mycobacteriales bacterium]|nr:DUF1365 domain-containing protein [Mycobacteriales bacterium]